MKNFIYLDTDFITSALSQINNGRIETITDETQDTNQKTQKNESYSQNSTAGFKAGIPGIISINAGNSDVTNDSESSYSEIETAKQIITKTFDDNMFDVLLNAIPFKEFENSAYAGDFVKSDDYYTLIDLDYTSSALEKNFLETLIDKNLVKKNVEKNLNTLSPEEKQKSYANINSIVNKEYKKQHESYGIQRKRLEALKVIFPSKILLYVNGILLLMDRKFLREDTLSILFKYSGKINIFAQITREYKSEEREKTRHNLDFTDLALSIILGMYRISDKNVKYIGTPIGVYFE